MVLSKKIKEIEAFINQEVDLFLKMLQNTTIEVYSAEPILRRAIDKSLNDIVLASVDLAAILLRIKRRVIPKTYKEIILSTYEFIGDITLKIAPLVACRNDTIHGYLKLSWNNVKTIRNAKDDILLYVNKIVSVAEEESP